MPRHTCTFVCTSRSTQLVFKVRLMCCCGTSSGASTLEDERVIHKFFRLCMNHSNYYPWDYLMNESVREGFKYFHDTPCFPLCLSFALRVSFVSFHATRQRLRHSVVAHVYALGLCFFFQIALHHRVAISAPVSFHVCGKLLLFFAVFVFLLCNLSRQFYLPSSSSFCFQAAANVAR